MNKIPILTILIILLSSILLLDRCSPRLNIVIPPPIDKQNIQEDEENNDSEDLDDEDLDYSSIC